MLYGSPEVTSGGNALKFYSSVRLDTRRKEILPENKGIRVKVKVVKNKIAAPFKAVMLDVLFGSGIDSMGCMVDTAQDLGVLDRRGSWYAYKGQQLAQGRANVIEFLRDHELKDAIAADVRVALSNYGMDSNNDDEAEAPAAENVEEPSLFE